MRLPTCQSSDSSQPFLNFQRDGLSQQCVLSSTLKPRVLETRLCFMFSKLLEPVILNQML